MIDQLWNRAGHHQDEDLSGNCHGSAQIWHPELAQIIPVVYLILLWPNLCLNSLLVNPQTDQVLVICTHLFFPLTNDRSASDIHFWNKSKKCPVAFHRDKPCCATALHWLRDSRGGQIEEVAEMPSGTLTDSGPDRDLRKTAGDFLTWSCFTQCWWCLLRSGGQVSCSLFVFFLFFLTIWSNGWSLHVPSKSDTFELKKMKWK